MNYSGVHYLAVYSAVLEQLSGYEDYKSNS